MKGIVALEVLSDVRPFDVVCVNVREESWWVDLEILDELLPQVQKVGHRRQKSQEGVYQVEYVFIFLFSWTSACTIMSLCNNNNAN